MIFISLYSNNFVDREVINHNDLIRKDVIGTGSFGVVFLCHDKRSNKYYALKQLSISTISMFICLK